MYIVYFSLYCLFGEFKFLLKAKKKKYMCVSGFRLKKNKVWSVGITFYFVKIFYSVGDVRIVKQ